MAAPKKKGRTSRAGSTKRSGAAPPTPSARARAGKTPASKRASAPSTRAKKVGAEPGRRGRASVAGAARALRLPPEPTGFASPHRARIKRLADLVGSAGGKGAAALLVTNPKDVGYLTGFLNGDSYLLVPADPGADAVIISDFRFQEELEPVRTGGIARVHIRKRSMLEAVTDVVGGSVRGPLAVQAEHVTVSLRQSLADKLSNGDASRLIDTTNLVGRLRAVKDELEIALITHAARIQEAALLAVLPTIKPGQTELEIAGLLEAEMKSRGSSEPGFQSIIAAGAHGSLPHYRPSGYRLEKNRPLLVDWGAVFQGYHSDMTRTFALGKWDPKIAEIYRIVLDAQEMAAAALAPGKTTTEIDAIARQHIASHGYGEYYGHGLGHGMGLDGHEEPRLSNMLAASTLVPGQVVTVEPGIYLPGIGGVRIEDDYVITATGAKNLCTLPKSMEWASR
ncbi:MAG: aminopeptidase P family protein [Phycisphaerales bacterium]|nr:aminopeptidase P family protein [Phycisphaerales bacterium]